MAAVDPIFLTLCIAAAAIVILIIVFGCVCARKKKDKSPIEFAAPLEPKPSKAKGQYEIAGKPLEGQYEIAAEPLDDYGEPYPYGEPYGDQENYEEDDWEYVDGPIYQNVPPYPSRQSSISSRYANQSKSALGTDSESCSVDDYDALGNYIGSFWYKQNYDIRQYYRNNNTIDNGDEKTALLSTGNTRKGQVSTAIDNYQLQSPSTDTDTLYKARDGMQNSKMASRIDQWEKKRCKSVDERLVDASPDYQHNRSMFAKKGLPTRWVAYTPSPGNVGYRKVIPSKIPTYVYSTRRQSVKEMVDNIKDRSLNDSRPGKAQPLSDTSCHTHTDSSGLRNCQQNSDEQQSCERENDYAGYLSGSNEPQVRVFLDNSAKLFYKGIAQSNYGSHWHPQTPHNDESQSQASSSQKYDHFHPTPSELSKTAPPPDQRISIQVPPPTKPTPPPQYVPTFPVKTPAKPILLHTKVMPSPPNPNKPASPINFTSKPVLIQTFPPSPKSTPRPIASPKPVAKPVLLPVSLQSSPIESPKPISNPSNLSPTTQQPPVAPPVPVCKPAAKPVVHQSQGNPLSPPLSPQAPQARNTSPPSVYGSPLKTPKTPPPLPLPPSPEPHLTMHGTSYRSPSPQPWPPAKSKPPPSSNQPMDKSVLTQNTSPQPIVHRARYITRFEVSPKLQEATGVKHKTVLHISPKYDEIEPEKEEQYTLSYNNNGTLTSGDPLARSDTDQEHYFHYTSGIIKHGEPSGNDFSTHRYTSGQKHVRIITPAPEESSLDNSLAKETQETEKETQGTEQEELETERHVHNFVENIIRKVSSEDLYSSNDTSNFSEVQNSESDDIISV